MAFADTLKKLRLEAGLTQQELATKSGVSQSAIAHWESGKRSGPGHTDLFKLADALGVDCSAFRDEDPRAVLCQRVDRIRGKASQDSEEA